jgi:hypothetical protein
MRLLCVLSGGKHFYHLRFGHLFRLVGKAVERRLAVDKYLQLKTEVILVLEQASGYFMLLTVFQPIKQVTTTPVAEPPLNRNVFLSVKSDVASTTNGHERTATPSPAHSAMTGVNVTRHIRHREAHRATKTSSFCFRHSSSSPSTC